MYCFYCLDLFGVSIDCLLAVLAPNRHVIVQKNRHVKLYTFLYEWDELPNCRIEGSMFLHEFFCCLMSNQGISCYLLAAIRTVNAIMNEDMHLHRMWFFFLPFHSLHCPVFRSQGIQCSDNAFLRNFLLTYSRTTIPSDPTRLGSSSTPQLPPGSHFVILHTLSKHVGGLPPSRHVAAARWLGRPLGFALDGWRESYWQCRES